MLWLALVGLLGCGDDGTTAVVTSDPPVSERPRSSHGTVLHASDGRLIVEHDDPLGRIVPGTERYDLADGVATDGLEPGDHVDLWVEEREPLRRVTAVSETGTDPLMSTFQAGGWPVTGTVVHLDGARVTVDHDPVPGLMDGMVMPFTAGADVTPGLQSGDRISGRIIVSEYGYHLIAVEVTGHSDASMRTDGTVLALGEVLPRLEIPVEDGTTVVVGAGQDKPTALTFLYTSCPDPSMCPALAMRLGGLQNVVGSDARLLAVTIDPGTDTAEVLAEYGSKVGADPAIWRFGRLEPVALHQLAMQAGLSVTVEGGKISHRLRLLVLDADGRLIERYDDAAWPTDRVAEQLRTGQPVAEGLGTLTGPRP